MTVQNRDAASFLGVPLAATSPSPGDVYQVSAGGVWTPTPASAPGLHASSHASGGADELTAAMVLEAQSKRLRESSGPTSLVIGAVADGSFLARSGTSIVGVAGGASALLPVIGDNTVNRQLTAAETGSLCYDTAGAGTMIFKLPTATVGLRFGFRRSSVADNALRAKATGTDTITHRGLTSAAAGYVEATRVGSVIWLVCRVAGLWESVAVATDDVWTVDGGSEWIAFTPSDVGGGWASHGTPLGYYRRRGREVRMRWTLTLTGAPTGTLVMAPVAGLPLDLTAVGLATYGPAGSACVLDSGNTLNTYPVLLNNSTGFIINPPQVGTDFQVTPTFPFTFGAGDAIEAVVDYTTSGP